LVKVTGIVTVPVASTATVPSVVVVPANESRQITEPLVTAPAASATVAVNVTCWPYTLVLAGPATGVTTGVRSPTVTTTALDALPLNAALPE
jgi:hypothetical protein